MSLPITDADKVLRKIKKVVRERDGDMLASLGEIDKILVKAGLPHIDPIYNMDEDDAKIFLVWLCLIGTDWFPEDMALIAKIIWADAEELGGLHGDAAEVHDR
jgi:hypothetical protein